MHFGKFQVFLYFLMRKVWDIGNMSRIIDMMKIYKYWNILMKNTSILKLLDEKYINIEILVKIYKTLMHVHDKSVFIF